RATAPNSGAATRMNRKLAPQMAPSTVISSGVTQSRRPEASGAAEPAMARATVRAGLCMVVTALHSFTSAWVIPRLPRFTASHPGIRLAFETEIALARFDDNGPDLGIRHGPGHWPGLSAQLLLREPLFPVAAPGMPGLDGVRDAAGIARLPLVAGLSRHGWAEWFRAAGVRGARPDERLVFTDSTDMLEAAAHGLGAALAREHVVTPWLASGRLRRL